MLWLALILRLLCKVHVSMYLNSISRFVVDYGFIPKTTRSEIKDLPAMLEEGEALIAIAEANIRLIKSSNINVPGLVAATNRRLILLSRSYAGARLKESILLTQISTANLKTTRTMCLIEVVAGGTLTTFWSYNFNTACQFYKQLQSFIERTLINTDIHE